MAHIASYHNSLDLQMSVMSSYMSYNIIIGLCMTRVNIATGIIFSIYSSYYNYSRILLTCCKQNITIKIILTDTAILYFKYTSVYTSYTVVCPVAIL